MVVPVLTSGMLTVLMTATGAACDKSASRAEELVDRLSWDSIEYGGGIFPTARVRGDAAEALIRMGSAADRALLSVLADPPKAVAAHLILTAIHPIPEEELPDGYIAFGQEYISEGDKIIGSKDTANGLSWYRLNDEFSVDLDALKVNAERWCERLEVDSPTKRGRCAASRTPRFCVQRPRAGRLRPWANASSSGKERRRPR